MSDSGRIRNVHSDEQTELVCAIGRHEFRSQGFVDVAGSELWIHVEVDGVAICVDHMALLSSERAMNGIPESLIKKAIMRGQDVARRAKVEDAMRAKAASNAPGFVYYVQVGDLVKIGYTSDLRARMASYPPNASVLGAHPGTRALEAEMHQRFKHLRARGREWFRPEPFLMSHIAAVTETFGPVGDIVKPMRHAAKSSLPQRVRSVIS